MAYNNNMQIERLAQIAVAEAEKQGASYADFRFEEIRTENVELSDGKPGLLDRNLSAGFGVRVLADFAWGFAASYELSEESVRRIARQAVEIAKTSAKINDRRVELARISPATDIYRTPYRIDPFSVSLAEKIELLKSYDALMHSRSDVNSTNCFMNFRRISKHFASSDGSEIEQELLHSGAGASCGVVKSRHERTERSFPSSSGQYMSKGYELIEEIGFEEGLPRIAEQAVALMSAKDTPSGTYDIVLSGDQVSLQIHESIGHALELDRVFGSERNFSGISFATPDNLGSLQYGSPTINVVANASFPAGLATWGYDDEGVGARPVELIRNGVLVGYLSNRESAVRIGRESSGSADADGWSNPPIVRITNVSLQPGETSFDDLIGGVDDGIYMETVEHWSIDDNRESFQLGCEIGWEIKGGKLGEMVKAPSYSSSTVKFWNSCDAVGDKSLWNIWGTPNCGKGQPAQNARTAQGASPCRFRQIAVGS
jgi:TldD protein